MLLVSSKVLGRKYVAVFVIVQVGIKAFVLITVIADSTADPLASYRSRSVPYYCFTSAWLTDMVTMPRIWHR